MRAWSDERGLALLTAMGQSTKGGGLRCVRIGPSRALNGSP